MQCILLMENARGTEDKRYNGTSLHRNHKTNTPVKRMLFFAMLLHNVYHKTSIFSEPPGTLHEIMGALYFCEDVIKRRSVTSRYNGGKISRSQQSFLTETAICIVERWKKSLGYRFASECNHAQESHTCQCCPRICGTTVC